jgi:hypothetical protein
VGQSPYWLHEDWDVCALGDIWLPGLATVTIPKLERDVEKKKAKGKSGGTMTDNGYKPGSCIIELWLEGEEEHRQWLQVLPRINPRREGATKDPFMVRYPSVIEAELGPMFVAALDLGQPPSAKGARKIKIYCEEWFDKPKAVKKGSGKAKSSATASPRTPIGNFMAPGTDPLTNPGSGLADPSDPNEIMEKALAGPNATKWKDSSGQGWV